MRNLIAARAAVVVLILSISFGAALGVSPGLSVNVGSRGQVTQPAQVTLETEADEILVFSRIDALRLNERQNRAIVGLLLRLHRAEREFNNRQRVPLGPLALSMTEIENAYLEGRRPQAGTLAAALPRLSVYAAGSQWKPVRLPPWGYLYPRRSSQ